MDTFLENSKIIIALITSITGIIVTVKTNFFNNNKVLKGNYLKFKTIREEYNADAINGYFAFQNFLKLRLSKDEIDYILNSSDAYIIISLIKKVRGNYIFEETRFKSKLSKTNYTIPILLYLSTAIPFLTYIFNIDSLITANGFKETIINICLLSFLLGPFIVLSMLRIKEISTTLYLDKITNKNRINKNKKKHFIIRFFSKINYFL